MVPRRSRQPRWYGSFVLAGEATGFWQVGPYALWVQRSAHEWRLSSMRGGDSLDSGLVVEVPSQRLEPPPGAEVRRFGFGQAPERVVLSPVCADRPVVVSPEQPLYLPAQEEIALFISTPVWLELGVGDPPAVLVDEPTHRPTDTWFGPSPMKGELCYATRTAARMKLESLPFRPHRAISEVDIVNRSSVTLAVEKLKIPAQHQSVYATADGRLWTETVTLESRDDESMASVGLGKGPPPSAPDAVLVRGPRVPMEPGLLTRTFGRLMR